VRLADDGVLANYVHAADVADGIARAAAFGRSGDHYVLGGENISVQGFLRLVSELAGAERRMVSLPAAMALAAARVAEAWGYLGGTAPITPAWVRVFLEDRRADIAPAKDVLGYAPRSLREGLAETIAWLGTATPRKVA
jgi:nucleoside-diphosphate-sugar epimerase